MSEQVDFDFSRILTPEEKRLAEIGARLGARADQGQIVTPGMISEAYRQSSPEPIKPRSRRGLNLFAGLAKIRKARSA